MKRTDADRVIFTLERCVDMYKRDKSVPPAIIVLNVIHQCKSSTTFKAIVNVSALTGLIPSRNVHTGTFVHMHIANNKFRPNLFIITLRMKTFTCFTTRLNSASWTWQNIKRTSVCMLITGKITEEILQFIHMNQSLVSTGKLNKWFMIIFVDAKVELLATCVMGGNNSLITHSSIRPTSVKIKIAEKDHAPITTHKRKKEPLTPLLPTIVSSSYPKTESLKEFSKTPPRVSFLNPSSRKSVPWFIKNKIPMERFKSPKQWLHKNREVVS